MITVEELKMCKHTPDDLIKVIEYRIKANCEYMEEHNYLEDGFCFDYNGISYNLMEVEATPWEDEGKYQYQTITYQLVSFDKSITSWVSKDNIIDKFDLLISINIQRSGSYFSEYFYAYFEPIIFIGKIKHIPEQIIPTHDEVELCELKNKMEDGR